MRSRSASETLGRPSAKRSPFHSGVYLITSSFVKKPCCGYAAGESTMAAAIAKNTVRSMGSTLRGLEPAGTGHLRPARGLLIHLHADTGTVRDRDIALLDNFSFFHEAPP